MANLSIRVALTKDLETALISNLICKGNGVMKGGSLNVVNVLMFL